MDKVGKRKGELTLKLENRSVIDYDAPNKSTAIINGRSSNILNWDDVRLPWVYPKYKQMVMNSWTPWEVQSMGEDKKQFFNELTENQRLGFILLFGSLISMDSVQTDEVMKFSDKITDSSINALLAILAKEEVIHNQSYSYILSSIDPGAMDKAFNLFKTDERLKKRNEKLFHTYQEFAKYPDDEAFLRAMVYDVILEGIFFYAGFVLAYDLARHGLMVSTNTMINWINRDEALHVGIFANIYRQTLADYPHLDTPELRAWTTEQLRLAAEDEIEWGNYLLGLAFETIDFEEVHGYIRFIANKRALELGVEKPFPKQRKNPLKWVKVYEDMDFTKTDFFEQRVRQYVKVDDKFDDM